MKKLKHILSLVLLVGLVFPANKGFAQQEKKKPDYSAYYYHRKNLFELLPNEKKEIIFLGDSITDGNEWAEYFGSQRIKNRGISGDVTDGVLYRLDEVTESHPAKVFLMIGVNDLAGGRSADYVVRNIIRIVDRIKEASPETKVFVQSVLPVNNDFTQFPDHVNKTDTIKEVNEQLATLAKKEGATYINLFALMSNGNDQLKPEYTEDGLHINGKGYIAWMERIAKYVE